VENFINANYLPVKIHIKEQPKIFERFGAQWTPTIQVLDPDGTKRHQFEGYLPPDDFLAQLQLGLAHSAFARQQWNEAETAFGEILTTLPESDASPEALYWQGVSRYKRAVIRPRCSRPQKRSRLVMLIARGQRKLPSGRSN
jgi:hypothetical protein